MIEHPTPTVARVRELLRYDETTGHFWWLRAVGRARIDKPAGTPQHGYVRITIDQQFFYAHRLVFLLETGEWPSEEVDHINGICSDNRRANLRLATRSENQRNVPLMSHNTSGFPGVGWDSRRSKWRAYIKMNRKMIHLGQFADKESAVHARKAAEAHYFGVFARG